MKIVYLKDDFPYDCHFCMHAKCVDEEDLNVDCVLDGYRNARRLEDCEAEAETCGWFAYNDDFPRN